MNTRYPCIAAVCILGFTLLIAILDNFQRKLLANSQHSWDDVKISRFKEPALSPGRWLLLTNGDYTFVVSVTSTNVMLSNGRTYTRGSLAVQTSILYNPLYNPSSTLPTTLKSRGE